MRNCSQRVSIALALFLCALSAHGTVRGKKTVEMKVVSATIRPLVKFEVSREIGPRRLVKAQSGRPGTVRMTYRITLQDGRVIQRELLKEERTEPKPTVFLMGPGGFEASRGEYVRHKVLTMLATGYDAMCCGTGITRTGHRAEYGVVAVDPRVIPLGSIVYVEGYGLALACDTGGAIKGHRIDLCYESRRVADAYGCHKVRVHILR